MATWIRNPSDPTGRINQDVSRNFPFYQQIIVELIPLILIEIHKEQPTLSLAQAIAYCQSCLTTNAITKASLYATHRGVHWQPVMNPLIPRENMAFALRYCNSAPPNQYLFDRSSMQQYIDVLSARLQPWDTLASRGLVATVQYLPLPIHAAPPLSLTEVASPIVAPSASMWDYPPHVTEAMNGILSDSPLYVPLTRSNYLRPLVPSTIPTTTPFKLHELRRERGTRLRTSPCDTAKQTSSSNAASGSSPLSTQDGPGMAFLFPNCPMTSSISVDSQNTTPLSIPSENGGSTSKG